MKRYLGGEKINTGMYLNLRTGEFLDINSEKAVLPGTNLNRFVKVPRWTPFIAGPAFGLFFVIFLPLMGIVALASTTVIKTKFMQGLLRQTGNRRTVVIK
jgi:hypothetical protein